MFRVLGYLGFHANRKLCFDCVGVKY